MDTWTLRLQSHSNCWYRLSYSQIGTRTHTHHMELAKWPLVPLISSAPSVVSHLKTYTSLAPRPCHRLVWASWTLTHSHVCTCSSCWLHRHMDPYDMRSQSCYWNLNSVTQAPEHSDPWSYSNYYTHIPIHTNAHRIVSDPGKRIKREFNKARGQIAWPDKCPDQ